ncbi:MAG: hypothetical protein AVDCRST_MAG32-1473, partial [uncultured Nocardioides sp.]
CSARSSHPSPPSSVERSGSCTRSWARPATPCRGHSSGLAWRSSSSPRRSAPPSWSPATCSPSGSWWPSRRRSSCGPSWSSSAPTRPDRTSPSGGHSPWWPGRGGSGAIGGRPRRRPGRPDGRPPGAPTRGERTPA